MHRRNFVSLMALALLLLVSAGCTQFGPQATPVPPTKTPKPTFTFTPPVPPTLAILPTATRLPPTPTAAPTNTPAPTQAPPTPTATPVPAPRFTANQTVNVRSGPGTNYPVIGQLSAGQSFDITSKNPNGGWLQFNYSGQQGWVSAELVAVSGDTAQIRVAQNIPAPPPPPTARPQPTAPPQPTATPAPRYPFQLLRGVERCEPNAGTTYFNGFVRYRNNSPRNGVCVHVAFYGPRVTKCSGCDGVGDGVWGFAPFGGPAPAGTTVEVFVVQCPPNIPPGGVTVDTPGGFGNLTPLSEKWVHTFAQSEQCTGITFVGD